VTEVLVKDTSSCRWSILWLRLDPRKTSRSREPRSGPILARARQKAEAESRFLQPGDSTDCRSAGRRRGPGQAEQRRIGLDIERITPCGKSGYASEEQSSNFRAQL